MGVPALRDTPRGGGLGGSRSRGFLSCVNKSRGHSQQCWPPSWAKGHSALQSGWLVTHWDLAGTQAPTEAAGLVLEAGRPGRNGRKSKGGAPGRRRGTCTDWQELGLGLGRRPGHTSSFSSEARSVCPRGGSVYADKTETRSSACWSPLQGHLTTGPPSEWLRRDEGVGEGCFSGHPTKIPVSQSIWLSPGGGRNKYHPSHATRALSWGRPLSAALTPSHLHSHLPREVTCPQVPGPRMGTTWGWFCLRHTRF